MLEHVRGVVAPSLTPEGYNLDVRKSPSGLGWTGIFSFISEFRKATSGLP
jgi:hypothetical protein